MFQETPIPEFPSRKLRAFSNITQMVPDNRLKMKKVILLIIRQRGRKRVDSALRAPDSVVY